MLFKGLGLDGGVGIYLGDEGEELLLDRGDDIGERTDVRGVVTTLVFITGPEVRMGEIGRGERGEWEGGYILGKGSGD